VSDGGFGPNYVGWTVSVLATAYVMADTAQDAEYKVAQALRKQKGILLAKIELEAGVPVESADLSIPERELSMPKGPYIVSGIPERELSMPKGPYIVSGPPESGSLDPNGNITEEFKPPKKRFCAFHREFTVANTEPCTLGFIGCTAKYWREHAGA
jgi:hypothetical protein